MNIFPRGKIVVEPDRFFFQKLAFPEFSPDVGSRLKKRFIPVPFEFFRRFFQSAPGHLRFKQVVGVQKGDIFPSGDFQAAVACRGLPLIRLMKNRTQREVAEEFLRKDEKTIEMSLTR